MQADAQSVSSSKEVAIVSDSAWPPKLPRMVLGALIGGAFACLVLKTMYPIFVVPDDIAILPDPPPTAAVLKLEAAQFTVDAKNFSILFGLIGAGFAAACALCAFGTRSISAAATGALSSAILGVVGVNFSNWIFTRLRSTSHGDMLVMGIKLDSMMQVILGYGLLWGLIGLGVGMGIGSVKSAGKAVAAGVAGLVGGFLAAMVYVMLIAQVTPNATMSHVFPTDLNSQVVWVLMFMVIIAATIVLGTGEKRRKAAA